MTLYEEVKARELACVFRLAAEKLLDHANHIEEVGLENCGSGTGGVRMEEHGYVLDLWWGLSKRERS